MLLEACDRGDISSVESLLNTENIEQKTPQGFTSLIIAAKQGNIPIMDLLIKSGANINASNNARQTPLFVACWNNQHDAVKKLIESKANLNQSDHRGWTPLIISVYQNYEEIVASLLDAGCDIEKKDCFGKQAIDRAKSMKMIEMIKSALAKQRKISRVKSPARVIRSTTPNSTSKVEKVEKVEIQRKRSNGSVGSRHSFDNRPMTPGSTNRTSPLSRASSERSLSIDFRKQLREKIDKKTREKTSGIEHGLYTKWNSVLNNNIQSVIRDIDLSQRKNWKTLLDNKGKEVYSKLKEFTYKSFEVIRQSKLPKSQKSAQGVVAGGVDELVSESISKFQYKYSNQLEKTLETSIERQVRKLSSSAKQEIFDFIQKSFNEAFFMNDEFKDKGDKKWKNSENTDKIYENSEKSFKKFENSEISDKKWDVKGSKTTSGDADKWLKVDEESFKPNVPKMKPKVASTKGTPQMNIASTLQEFLKFEQMSKS